MNTLVKRVGVAASGFALSACVYASPYSTAFPDTPATTVNGRRVPPASAATLCQRAHEDPASSPAVYACIRARGRDWDVRGHAIRRQASVVGQAAIPLGISSLGLSAAGERSDFVPLTAGVTTTALAHTGAYARPDQARVYEMATVAYHCLESAIGEWNSADQSAMNDAFTSLDESVAEALRYLDSDEVRTHIDEVERLASKAEIRRQRAAARVARNRMGGRIGSELLRRSGVIEDQVREAIGLRIPDPQVVAASLVRPAAGDGPVEMPDNSLLPAAEDPGLALTEEGEDNKAADDIETAVEARERVITAVNARKAAINALAEQFEEAANEYAAAADAIQVGCAFNPLRVPDLSAPEDVTLDDTNQGVFFVRGGVPPYRYYTLPRDGLSIAIQPSSTDWRFDLSASASGPWTVYVRDASGSDVVREVKVSVAP